MVSLVSLRPLPPPLHHRSITPLSRSKGRRLPTLTPSSPNPPFLTPPLSTPPGSLQSQCRPITPTAAKCDAVEGIRSEIERFPTRRRETLLHIFLASLSLPFLATDVSAETELQESFRSYEDEMNNFRISIPKDWLVGAGDANGIKSVTAFFPEETTDSNVSVVITGLGPDFTGLKSFGDVDAFAETLVSGLDRSWRRPPGVTAKLINSKAANGLYYIEYTLQNPGERCRHILTALGVANNGWYNRLYTVTGQFMEDEADKYQPQIVKTVSSFRLT